MTDRQNDRQTEWQTGRMTDKQNDRQTDRQNDRQTDRQNDRQTEWQTDRMTDRQKYRRVRIVWILWDNLSAETGNPYWRGRISTVDLLVQPSSNQLLFIPKAGNPKGEVSLYCWPPVWLVWNLLYDYWQFLFLFAKQAYPNQSNRRSMVQWYFPLLYFLPKQYFSY